MNPYCYLDLPISKARANLPWEGAWSLEPGKLLQAPLDLHGFWGSLSFHYTHLFVTFGSWIQTRHVGLYGKQVSCPEKQAQVPAHIATKLTASYSKTCHSVRARPCLHFLSGQLCFLLGLALLPEQLPSLCPGSRTQPHSTPCPGTTGRQACAHTDSPTLLSRLTISLMRSSL